MSGESQKVCKGVVLELFNRNCLGCSPREQKENYNQILHLIDVLYKKLGTKGLHENKEKQILSVPSSPCNSEDLNVTIYL